MSKASSTSTLVERHNAGLVDIAIWQQENDKGDYFTATVSRNYRDKAGDWKNGRSFGLQDLIALQFLLGNAIASLMSLEHSRRNGDTAEVAEEKQSA